MTKSLEPEKMNDIGVFLLQCAGAIDDGLVLTVQDVGSLARLLEEFVVEVGGDDDPRGKYWDGMHGDLATDKLRKYMDAYGDEQATDELRDYTDAADDIDGAVDTLNATADALEAALANAIAEQSNG